MPDAFETPKATPTEPVTPAEASALDALVGEGKKYATPEELAKAYQHADAHIGTLTQDNATLKEEVAKRQSVSEVVDALKQPTTPPTQDTANTQAGLSAEEVRGLVTTTTQELQQQALKDANRNVANAAMADAWGDEDSVRRTLEAKAAEVGVSVPFLKDVAEQSPDAFKQLVGLSGSRPKEPNPLAEHARHDSSDSLMHRDVDPKLDETKWEYWQHMRRTDFTRFNSFAEQNRRVRLVEEGKLDVPK